MQKVSKSYKVTCKDQKEADKLPYILATSRSVKVAVA